MNGFHDIHCPFCGSIISPQDVRFSITEFVQEIFNQRLDEKYNDGILGVIDSEEINLILDNDYLWDMSVPEIESCYDSNNMFVLAGENLIKRFGFQVVDMLSSISEATLDEIAQSPDVNYAINSNEQVRNLIAAVLGGISEARLFRTEVQVQDRDAAVLNLIRYAKSNKILFKIHLKVEPDRDDQGKLINKDIRSVEGENSGRIICKSKRCCNCGEEISKMAGKYEEKIISFIGSPAAGKSAYLAAVIDKLLNCGRSEYDIEVIFDYQSSDYIAFNEACLLPYSKGFAITKTNQGTFPQLSMALKNSQTGKTFLYTFVDIPGETFIDENGCNISDLLSNRRVIRHASVIWYCVSAKQFFSSRMGLSDILKAGDSIENEEMSDLKILGSNTIKFAGEMFPDDIPTPAVAVVLTKSDLISDFIMENIFSGDPQKNKLIKKEYFKTICSAPQGGYYDEDFDYYDGEPTSLGYLYNKKFIYQKYLTDIRRTTDFIKQYGDSDTEVFLGNIATAFRKKECPCFSEASYGRSPVEKYSMETAVRYILANKEKILPRDLDALKKIFGEAELEAFEQSNARLPIIKDERIIKAIQDMYKKHNPVFPFGIMSILEWTFAYTGFVECVENDGMNWQTIPTDGPIFEDLKTRLTFETNGGNVLAGHPGPDSGPKEEEKKPIWKKIFN